MGVEDDQTAVEVERDQLRDVLDIQPVTPNLDDDALVAAVLRQAKHLALGRPFDRAT